MPDPTNSAPIDDDPEPIEPEALAAARAALAVPPPKKNGSVVLLISMAFFTLSILHEKDLSHIVIILGVILFHELGHLAGMRVFGYQDLSIFFIPFLGAAASGRKTGAPAWQQVIVLFLGPLPGIAAGGVLAFLNLRLRQPLLGDIAASLFLINVFNLIPLAPFDGGRVFELALFRRHWVLEAGFTMACILGLTALAFTGSWLLLMIAAWLLFALPHRVRLRREITALRRQVGHVSGDLAQVDDATLAAMYSSARRLRRAAGQQGEPLQQQMLRAVWEDVAQEPLSAPAAVLALFVWLACIVTCFIGTVLFVAVQKGE